jgi:hypothetical protein
LPTKPTLLTDNPPLLRGARAHLAQKLAFELAQELEQQAVLMKQNKPAKNTAAAPYTAAEVAAAAPYTAAEVAAASPDG